MKLREKILNPEAIKDAMKNKDNVKLNVIRHLKSEIQRTEGGKGEMNDNLISNLIKKNIQNIKESKNDNWEEEVKTLSEFLPKQLSKDDVGVIIEDMVDSGMSSIGPIMARFTKEYGGRADGKMVSSLVKEKLGI